MVAEDSREGIWSLQRVDKSARGIGKPTGGEEDYRGDPFVVREPR